MEKSKKLRLNAKKFYKLNLQEGYGSSAMEEEGSHTLPIHQKQPFIPNLENKKVTKTSKRAETLYNGFGHDEKIENMQKSQLIQELYAMRKKIQLQNKDIKELSLELQELTMVKGPTLKRKVAMSTQRSNAVTRFKSQNKINRDLLGQKDKSHPSSKTSESANHEFDQQETKGTKVFGGMSDREMTQAASQSQITPLKGKRKRIMYTPSKLDLKKEISKLRSKNVLLDSRIDKLDKKYSKARDFTRKQAQTIDNLRRELRKVKNRAYSVSDDPAQQLLESINQEEAELDLMSNTSFMSGYNSRVGKENMFNLGGGRNGQQNFSSFGNFSRVKGNTKRIN